jgi:hypothetical protein
MMKKGTILFAFALFAACAAFAQGAPADEDPNIISQIFTGVIENYIGKTTFAVLAGSMGICTPPASYGNIYLSLVQSSIIAVLVSLLLSVVLFFIGRMLRKEAGAPPSSFLSLKITDAMVSIILIVLVGLAYFQSGGPDYIPLLRGMEYVSTVISLTVNSYFFMMVMNWMMHFMMGVTIPLDILSQVGNRMMSISLDKILSPVVTLITILSTYSNLVVGEFITKLGLLCFVRSSMFYIMLPLGFFLRGFGIGKGAGNAIIALCIALHFFYPIMLTMNFAIFNADMAMNAEELSTDVLSSAAMYAKFAAIPLMLKVAGAGVSTVAKPLANANMPAWFKSPALIMATSGIVNLMTVMSKFSSFWVLAYVTFVATTMFQGTYGVILFLVKLIALYGMILTAIDIFATLMFARELSGILGTPIELSAFMKIL